MSDESREHSAEGAKQKFDHGLDPKPKESFKNYSARKSSDFESSSSVLSLRKYLNSTEPAMLMIHALVVFFVSLIFAYFASQSIGTDLANQSAPFFFGTLSTLVRVSSMMLVAWAVGRLIADSIKDGAKS